MDSSESADDLVQYNYVTQEELEIGKISKIKNQNKEN